MEKSQLHDLGTFPTNNEKRTTIFDNWMVDKKSQQENFFDDNGKDKISNSTNDWINYDDNNHFVFGSWGNGDEKEQQQQKEKEKSINGSENDNTMQQKDNNRIIGRKRKREDTDDGDDNEEEEIYHRPKRIKLNNYYQNNKNKGWLHTIKSWLWKN